MLAIRMQRTGRSGHAQFRVIVQDSRFSPTRGRIVSYLGSYNPHTKAAKLDSQKAAQYLQNGARPSDSVARLLKKEGIKLPAWVKLDEPKKRQVRNPQKRRSTAPAQPEVAATAEPQAEITEETATEITATEAPTEENAPQTDSTPEPAPETPAEEPAEPSTDEPVPQTPAEPTEAESEQATETPIADEPPAAAVQNS